MAERPKPKPKPRPGPKAAKKRAAKLPSALEALEASIDRANAERDALRAKVAELESQRAEGTKNALRELDKANDRAEAAEKELERWRHGKQVEGDYVCPDSPAPTAAERRVAELTLQHARTRAMYLDAVSWHDAAEDRVRVLEEALRLPCSNPDARDSACSCCQRRFLRAARAALSEPASPEPAPAAPPPEPLVCRWCRARPCKCSDADLEARGEERLLAAIAAPPESRDEERCEDCGHLRKSHDAEGTGCSYIAAEPKPAGETSPCECNHQRQDHYQGDGFAGTVCKVDSCNCTAFYPRRAPTPAATPSAAHADCPDNSCPGTLTYCEDPKATEDQRREIAAAVAAERAAVVELVRRMAANLRAVIEDGQKDNSGDYTESSWDVYRGEVNGLERAADTIERRSQPEPEEGR